MPVSTSALKQIAVVGGIISLGGAGYFYKAIQGSITVLPQSCIIINNMVYSRGNVTEFEKY